ncbi:exodeoxyribonuclease V subunit gamma [Solidesulfovibrio carbinolicus]|uniref:exodeoxyribonuclease V subunit gamma n=1 Tax=Solidesulfovibrio carbinolicus TaxID=296842 RepID=UPI0013EC7D4E|nr:exodeoxyribonuclease V subunit gamma [Solidesulfovibrio carbinolicus]
MNLTVIAGNRLETLVDTFLRDTPPPADPFAKRLVVVQNRGMERHLRMEMARRHGVCCGMEFPFPVTLAYRLFSRLVPDLPKEDDSSQAAMTWRILAALETPAVRDPSVAAFEPVRRYLGDGSPLKAWQLAREIARTFDRYLIFRPDMVQAWEDGHPDNTVPHEAWQALLWQVIWREGNCHRVRARERFFQSLAGNEAAKALPETIAFFAVASLPRFYTDIFTEIARHVPITFYLLEPAPSADLPDEASGDTSRETSLAWNEAGANYRARLVASATHRETCYSPPTGDRILDLLHQDLFGTVAPSDKWREALRSDAHSVQVHCCHGPVRELEVLQDVLLDILQRRPDIDPRDIVVMMPDPASRSGYVRAVFESATPRDRRVPFRIVAPGRSEPEPVIETLFRLLAIPLERFSLASVLSLLECEAIRARFGLAARDRTLVSDWFTEAGARWAIDAAHKTELGLPSLDDFTWSSAAARLILGHALPEDGHRLCQGVAPLEMAEGTGAAILGRFLEFFSTLVAVLAPLDEPASMTQWHIRLCSLLENMFAGPEAESGQLVEQTLAAMAYEAERAGCATRLDLQTVTEALRERLDEGGSSTGLFSGAVTFSDMQALRGVPFKVVAVIGLDDGAFPGRNRRPGFDLMQARPQPGDPEQRADDRRLLLEAILSAREIFIMTYRGRTQEENAALPPSVAISELLDCIDSRSRSADEPRPSERLLRIHRLQSFHSDYFRPHGDPRFFSYSSENCQCARERGKGGTPFVTAALDERPGLLPAPLGLDLLRRFLENPCRFFLENRLGVRFPKDGGTLETTEPLDGLNRLERYLCCQDVLNDLFAGTPIQDISAHLQRANRLPPGAPGLFTLHDIQDTTHGLMECVNAACDGMAITNLTASTKVTLPSGPILIKGSVQGVLPDRLLRWRPGTIRPRDQLSGWLDHVFLHASACGRPETLLIGTKGQCRLTSPTDPEGVLKTLLALLLRGTREPVPFFPKTSEAFAKSYREKKDTAVALKKAEEAWYGNEYRHIEGDGADRHFAKCFPDATHLRQKEFQKIACAVFDPLLNQLEKIE